MPCQPAAARTSVLGSPIFSLTALRYAVRQSSGCFNVTTAWPTSAKCISCWVTSQMALLLKHSSHLIIAGSISVLHNSIIMHNNHCILWTNSTRGVKMFPTKTSRDVGMVNGVSDATGSSMEKPTGRKSPGTRRCILWQCSNLVNIRCLQDTLWIHFHHPYIWQHFDAALLSWPQYLLTYVWASHIYVWQ